MHDDSNKSKISLLLHVGIPTGEPKQKKPNIEDQVRACIQRIDDGTGDEVDFLLLRRLKCDLMKRDKKNPRVANLLKMIEPTLRRFGYYY
jgi:hypothetical protein